MIVHVTLLSQWVCAALLRAHQDTWFVYDDKKLSFPPWLQ